MNILKLLIQILIVGFSIIIYMIVKNSFATELNVDWNKFMITPDNKNKK